MLASAEEPLSARRIQRRVATDGFDAATSAIREACEALVPAGDVEAVGDPPRRKYRRVDDGN